jgi:hypothetical protein
MKCRPENEGIQYVLTPRKSRLHYIKMKPGTGSICTAVSSLNEARSSFNEILSEFGQQDTLTDVPAFLASLYRHRPGLFDESQAQIIKSVCSSIESQQTRSIQSSLGTSDRTSSQEENEVVKEDKDPRSDADRIKKMAKGGDLRPLLSTLINAHYSQGDRDPMELIEDCHLITCGGPLQPYSCERNDFIRICTKIQEIQKKPAEERKKHLDGLIVEICQGLAYVELDRNEKLDDAAKARGEVYKYTEFFQPPCGEDEVLRQYWFEYKRPA